MWFSQTYYICNDVSNKQFKQNYAFFLLSNLPRLVKSLMLHHSSWQHLWENGKLEVSRNVVVRSDLQSKSINASTDATAVKSTWSEETPVKNHNSQYNCDNLKTLKPQPRVSPMVCFSSLAHQLKRCLTRTINITTHSPRPPPPRRRRLHSLQSRTARLKDGFFPCAIGGSTHPNVPNTPCAIYIYICTQ